MKDLFVFTLSVSAVVSLNSVYGMETTPTDSGKQSSVNLQKVQNVEWREDEVKCNVDQVYSIIEKGNFPPAWSAPEMEWLNFDSFDEFSETGLGEESKIIASQLNNEGKKLVRFLDAKGLVIFKYGYIYPRIYISQKEMHELFVSFCEFRDKLVPQIIKEIPGKKELEEDTSGFLKWLIQEPWVFDTIRNDYNEDHDTAYNDCFNLFKQYSLGWVAPQRKK